MLYNYLKIAFRNLWKNKVSTSINVISLSIGIACSILIILFVKNEWTYDVFLTKADRIYRPYVESERRAGNLNTSVYTPHILGTQMKENFEGIEATTVVNSFDEQVAYKDRTFGETVNIASPEFFQIFDYQVADGSIANVLDHPNNLVITEVMKEKYFGDQPAIGEEMTIRFGDENRSFVVRAVLENIPPNSSLQFDLLISDLNAKDLFPEQMLTSWFMISGTNYVLLKEGVSQKDMEAQFPSLVQQVIGERIGDRKYDIYLQSIKDIHLNNEMPAGFASVSDPKYTFILAGIAGLILILACINFMILSIGRAMTRAKEIGVRKVVGAAKGQLMRQFLSESILLSFIALVIGGLLAYLTLNLFNQLSGKNLIMEFDLVNVGLFISLAGLVGLVAGIYPALILSGLKPVTILKGNMKLGSGKEVFKKMLVGAQFVLSIFLVSTTIIMQQQLSYLQNKNLGFDQEQMIGVPINVDNGNGIRSSIVEGFKKSKTFKQVLKNNPDVLAVAGSSQDFGRGNWMQLGYNDEQDNHHTFYMNVVDHDYLNALGIKLLEGRDFSEEIAADARRSMIVNEAFVKAFGLKSAVGDRIPNPEFADHEIIGVVENFHFASLHSSIDPAVLLINSDIGFSGAQDISINSMPNPKMMIRLAPNDIPTTISAINELWNQVYPGEEFNYDFVDDVLNTQYSQEQNLGEIVSTSTTLAVIIACLGLFGLASLTMSNQIKEVSVRKVLGASMGNIILLLSKGYILLIIIALLVSVPATYFFAQEWLKVFEYKINIGADAFLLAGAITILVAIITISYQCIKVSMANPAKTLSNE
jgi:putative ABC transport system permease protein